MKQPLRHTLLAPQLTEILLRRIWLGQYAPGSRLPSVRELQREFQRGRHSVEAAVRALADSGWLKVHPGRTPLVTARRRPGVYRIAFCISDGVCDTVDFGYEESPRSWLYLDAVRRALRERRQACAALARSDDWNHAAGFVDGIVRFDFGETPDRSPGLDFSVPVMTVRAAGRECDEPDTICVDRDAAVDKAAYYLISHGVRTVISLQRGNDALHTEREGRLRGILRDYSFEPVVFQVGATGDILEKCAAAPLERLLRKNPALPLGIFAQGDLLARGSARIAAARGWKFKKDVVVIGCTGLTEAAHWQPAITSITSPFAELGECAAQTILERLRSGVPQPPRRVTGKFIIRET